MLSPSAGDPSLVSFRGAMAEDIAMCDAPRLGGKRAEDVDIPDDIRIAQTAAEPLASLRNSGSVLSFFARGTEPDSQRSRFSRENEPSSPSRSPAACTSRRSYAGAAFSRTGAVDMGMGKHDDRLVPRRELPARDLIAFIVIGIGIIGVILVSAVAIWFATDADRPEMARLVFAAALPLLGTWVGTVLAFYFARENLDAATRSTIQLTRRLAPETPVRDAMIPADKIIAHRVADVSAAKAIRLAALSKSMKDAGKHRIPILDAGGRVLYVVHDSTLATYSHHVTEEPSTTTKTLGDLLTHDPSRKAVEAIGFVRLDAVLADARAAMQLVPDCNDVFVTQSGRKEDAMIGWLTNTDLAETEDAARRD